MTLRLAFQGTGKIAGGCAKPAKLGGCEIVAVASRTPEKAHAFIEHHHDAVADGCRAVSYGDLLEADDIDAVYNALPNNLHVGWSIALLEAGKHVLCEKPTTPHPAEMERVAETSRRTGKVWQEAFMYPHHPQTDALIEIARTAIEDPDNSVIGRLHSVRASAMVDLGDGPHVEHRLRHSTQGGALGDLGVYPVGICRYVTGLEPVEGSVRATGRPARMPSGESHPVDGGIFVSFALPGDIICQTAASLDAWGGHGLQLIGTKAAAETGFPFWPDPTLATIDIRKSNQTIDTIEVKLGGDRIEHQFRNFAAACKGEMQPKPSLDWSIGQAKTLDAIWSALGWEKLPPSPSV